MLPNGHNFCVEILHIKSGFMHKVGLSVYLYFSVFLSVLHPDFPLALWVNQQGVSCGLGGDYTILYGQIIIGQTLDIPFTNL